MQNVTKRCKTNYHRKRVAECPNRLAKRQKKSVDGKRQSDEAKARWPEG